MRNLTKAIIALFAVLAVSCTIDEVKDRAVIEPVTAPVLTAPATGASYVLKPENAAAQAERFVWNSADYGGPVEINYTIEIDKKGHEFATPKSLGAIKAQNQLSVTVEAMNGAALSLGATPFTPSDYDVRIKAVTGLFTPMYSNVINITISAYTTENPKLWIPGNFQEASGYGGNWTPSTGPQLAASGFGKTDFEGFAFINDAAAAFKFTPTSSNFDGDYGDAVGPDGVYSGKLLQTGEKNAGLPTPKATYYLIKADTDPTKLTYTLTEAVWGITGDATPGGWPDGDDNSLDHDSMMTYNKDTKTWTLTLALTAGKIKFRANNKNWSLNFGDTGADGTLEYGGSDITVPSAGNYTVTLDLSKPRAYTYSLKKN